MGEGTSVDFGIGVLYGVWKSPKSGDIILQISFHAMTIEDVVLLFATLVPAWCLLWHLCFTAIPECWAVLGEKAAQDEATDIEALAQQQQQAYTPLDGEIDVDDLQVVDGKVVGDARVAPVNGGANGTANGDGDGGFETRRASVSFIAEGKPSRPTRPTGYMPPPEALPAPGPCMSCWQQALQWLPVQLRPRAVLSRAKSFWKRPGSVTTSERLWGCISDIFTNCICCVICGSLFARLLPTAKSNRRHSRTLNK